jgi:branched-chain amino acid transport system permease protein
MDILNLSHGVVFMTGAYLAVSFSRLTGSLFLATMLAVGVCFLIGLLIERLALRSLYGSGHLPQVLATFGIVYFVNDAVRLIWGTAGMSLPLPPAFQTFATLPGGIPYPTWRLLTIGVGCAVALFLYVLIQHTRIGMVVRAGASNRRMAAALGANIDVLFMAVFGLGAALAGLAGIMAAPLLTVGLGMGDAILVTTFVVIVVGGVGSVRGAFVASILVGMIDTLGRTFMPDLVNSVLGPKLGAGLGAALASMFIYLLMSIFLVVRPQGLFPATGRQ